MMPSGKDCTARYLDQNGAVAISTMLARNEYLAAESRITKAQLISSPKFSDAEVQIAPAQGSAASRSGPHRYAESIGFQVLYLRHSPPTRQSLSRWRLPGKPNNRGHSESDLLTGLGVGRGPWSPPIGEYYPTSPLRASLSISAPGQSLERVRIPQTPPRRDAAHRIRSSKHTTAASQALQPHRSG